MGNPRWADCRDAWIQESWWWCQTFCLPFHSILHPSVMVSFSSSLLLCGSPRGSGARLTVQKEDRLSPTSRVVDTRTDSFWPCCPSQLPLEPGAQPTLVPESLGWRRSPWLWDARGLYDFGTFSSSLSAHVCRVCTYLFCNKPGCLMKALCWNQIP